MFGGIHKTTITTLFPAFEIDKKDTPASRNLIFDIGALPSANTHPFIFKIAIDLNIILSIGHLLMHGSIPYHVR
jgi:hypothetical protein